MQGSDDLNSEEALASRLAAGDVRGAAALLVELHGPALRRFLSARHPDRAELDEVCQRAAVVALERLTTFEGRSSLKTWFLGLGHHTSLQFLEAKARERRAVPVSEAPSMPSPVRTQTAPHQQSGWKARFRELRGTLRVEDQQLLFLRVDQGLPWAEVARVLEGEGAAASTAALRKRFERVTAELRERAVAAGWWDEL